MELDNYKRILRFAFPLFISCAVIALIYSIMMTQKEQRNSTKPNLRKLPDDVEMVMERYTFRETDEGLDIKITGDRIVHRGKELLGLRSNLVKSVYFQNLHGTLTSAKVRVGFSAEDAEWDAVTSKPLMLRRNVSMSINEKKIEDVNNASIYLRQGVIKIDGKQKKIISLR